jgi:hypothetical protein
MAEYLGMSDKVSEMMAEQEFAAAGKVLKREAALLEVCTVCVPHDAAVQDAYNTSKRFFKDCGRYLRARHSLSQSLASAQAARQASHAMFNGRASC